jgi:diguanylate cyclase (GGDEF)-like protein
MMAVLAAALLGYDGFTGGATLAAVASLMTCLVIRQIVILRASQQRLDELTLHDPLTGLPNRALLLDRVSHALARAQRRNGRVAALFVDLDNFKLVNDSLGHPAGDGLLVAVAGRVRGCLRDEDTLARLGGDELAILIEDVHDEANAIAVAERVQAALAQPFEVLGHTLFTTASIGLALSGPTVRLAASLLRNADLAMYQAKTSGKSRWARFDPALNDAADERLEIETALRAAVERGELWVAYQPMVHLETGTVREVEALLRWQHPTRGSIAPARFVPVAEASGLIVQIGGWVLAEACRQAARWQRSFPGREPLSVSVNLSGRQLQDPGLVETVARVLVETGLESAALKLELTETVVMESTEATFETLSRLRELGVRLAIDDFGTGYSSFAYLKQFPVDALKIDRSFVAGLGRDAQDGAIVQSVISLARGLGLTVIGEGVETAEQAVTLKQLGCHLAQGYYYARPLAPAQVEPILATLCPRDEPAAGPPEAHDARPATARAGGRIVPFPERAPLRLPHVP